MGYESKIYIVEDTKNHGMEIKAPYYGRIICEFDLCKMPYESGWRNLFKTPIPFYGFFDGEEETQEDRYGEHIKYGEWDEVIAWCENFMLTNDYWRVRTFLALLKGFDKSMWGSLRICHYGY